MGLVTDLGDERQIITTETGRVLPVLAVFVQTADGDVVSLAALGVVLPNGRFDASHADFVNRSRLRCS